MTSLARAAFVRAVSNDHRGLVSRADAERILEGALTDITTSDAPQAAFDNAARYVSASRSLLGTDAHASATLNTFSGAGASAVLARLEALTGQTQLPQVVEKAFADLVEYDELGVTGPISLSNVQGNATAGFSFDYKVGDTSGQAFAAKFDGAWILSPIKLTAADVDAATNAMRNYFDSYWVTDLRSDWGLSDAEIDDMRAAITVDGFVWPANPDPIGIADSYPVALSFNNPTGSDHGFWAGYNPATGDSDAGDFN